MGVVAGVVGYIVARFLEKALHSWLNRNDMKMQLTLGQAILKMQREFDKGAGYDPTKDERP